VSMLEALAVVRGGEGKFAVALDAGRGEVYVGEFTVAGSRATAIREYLAKLDALAAEATAKHLTVVSPDAKVVEALTAAGAVAQQVDPIPAEEIGRLGWLKLLAGEVSDVATLDANYIRRSDAEILSQPKP